MGGDIQGRPMIMYFWALHTLRLCVCVCVCVRVGTVTSFKYLGSVMTDESSKPEIHSRISRGNSSIDKVETSLE